MTDYILQHDSSKCYGCRACEQICPQKAITMQPNEEGFLYPVLDETICIKCGLCSQICPINTDFFDSDGVQRVYAAQYKQEASLMNSSSGGVFSAAADYVLNHGGAVAGCIFDENFTAVHKVSQNPDTIAKMRGSKYVQSDMGHTFLDIKKRLEDGQLVLFTGTPCQVDGLNRFLRKKYDNLYTLDLICHGVPSPALFSEYLKYAEQKKGSITDIKFRNKKRNGWCSQGSISHSHAGKTKIRTTSPYNDSYYYYYYLQNNISRMCCYSCKYSTVHRVGDLTIGDYWNVNDVLPSLDISKGISVVLVNNGQGQKLIERIKDKLLLLETDLSSAVKGNGNLSKPCKLPESRKEIYQRIKEQGYAAITKQDCQYQHLIPFLRKHTPKAVKRFLKKVRH